MSLTFYQPLFWLLVILVLGIGFALSLVDRPARLKWASFLFRILGIVLLVLALCRPVVKRDSEDLHVVYLLDVSESVDLGKAAASVETIETSIKALKPGDSHTLFAVGNGLRSMEPAELKTTLESWESGIGDDRFRSESRLGEALLSSRLSFPAGKSKRVVLITDGQETQGALTDALRILKEEAVEVQWAKLPGLSKPESAVVAVEASTPNAFKGEMVRMEVKLASNQAMAGRLRVLHKGVAVEERPVTFEKAGAMTMGIDVEMTTPGSSRWTAELVPDEDYFPLNNQASTTVQVRGQPRLLILHEKPRDMRPMSRALKEQEFEVDVRGINGLPASMEELLAFDGIVLADIPATNMSTRQMELLKRYVTDFGGGLAMFGSENSFGLGGYYKTPVEEVLPLISRFEKEKEKPSLAMILVMDKSGSMGGAPIAMARQAAKASVELLGQRDQIGVIGFDSSPQIISEIRPATERDAIQAAIDSIAAGGGTDLYPAMVAGKDMLDNVVAKVKHMIVLSDGQTGGADFQGLTQAMTDSGITVSTVALGQGAARELLAGIAEIGRGRYYETMDESTVPQIFTKETMQASKSAIKEDLYGTVQTGDHAMLAGYTDDELPFSLG
ncbi:MAG: VWA domain-containing protein, partial [Verrucomicrobiota bacterium]